MFGLQNRDIDNILKAVSHFPNINKVIIFGSRAMGNYKPTSDINIAISTDNKCYETAIKLSGILNDELPIPYFIDVLDLNFIENENLLNHIKKYGKQLV